MPITDDDASASRSYARPPRLVSTEWMSANIGNPAVKVVESDEELALYDIGHIPGAVRIDRLGELDDPVVRDCVDGAGFAALMHAKGIGRDDTVVLYGDKTNRWAVYCLWIFTLFGHEDVRLLDGGRTVWHAEDRETTLDLPHRTDPAYPTVDRDDTTARIFRNEVTERLGSGQLLDVRSPAQYRGERVAPTARPAEPPLRGGHLPGARNIPWDTALAPDGRFRPVGELREIYRDLRPDDAVIVYCHTGELACHTWFVLTDLLGFTAVRCYDGSWAEWGNAVRLPIAGSIG